MEYATFLVILCAGDQGEQIYEKYKDYAPKNFQKWLRKGGQIILPFEPDSPQLLEAQAITQDFELSSFLTSETYYTPKELRTHPYFELLLPWPLELEGTSAKSYGTQYQGGCPYCGRGKKHIGDVYVDRKFVRKYRMGTLVNEIFANEETKKIVQENQLTGISFPNMLKDYKGRELNGYHIAEVNSILQPLSDKTWLESSGFPKENCGHQIIYLRSPLRYEAWKLADAVDFNLTAEYLNNFSEQGIVVSAKVKQILTSHRIFSRFRPIDIV